MKNYTYKYDKEIEKTKLQELFKSVEWESAEYPNRLHEAIKNSSYVMTAWDDGELIGLISAISDGYINVFITYLLVNPKYQNKGLGKIMMSDFCEKYKSFGRQILTTETDKEGYYNKFGFSVEGISMFNNNWEGDI